MSEFLVSGRGSRAGEGVGRNGEEGKVFGQGVKGQRAEVLDGWPTRTTWGGAEKAGEPVARVEEGEFGGRGGGKVGVGRGMAQAQRVEVVALGSREAGVAGRRKERPPRERAVGKP